MKTKLTIIAVLFSMIAFGQEQSWPLAEKYNKIVQKIGDSGKLTYAGMSDDEIAGVLLKKAGSNFRTAAITGFLGVVTFSAAAWGPTVFAKDDADTQQTIIYGAAIGGGLFTFISFVAFLNGSANVEKAGIVFQHKKFNIKTTGTSVSLNF